MDSNLSVTALASPDTDSKPTLAPVISVQQIVHKYENRTALAGVSFDVAGAELFESPMDCRALGPTEMWGKADGALCRHRGYEPAPHHRLLIDRLERVACGEIKRPAVFMPPGSAKSTYASVLFPPHVMASAASHAILATSHTTE